MYNLNDEQITEVKSFINKLPDSMVRSKIQQLFEDGIFQHKRMTYEQLEKFLSYQSALPVEVNTYPQSFAQWAKNREVTEQTEKLAKTPEKDKANLGATVRKSTEGINLKKEVKSAPVSAGHTDPATRSEKPVNVTQEEWDKTVATNKDAVQKDKEVVKPVVIVNPEITERL